MINLDDYGKAGTHWVAVYCSKNNVTYFDSFGVEHIPKEVKKFVSDSDKNVVKNIYRIQADDSVMCGYFCIGFIDYMLNGKSLIDFTNLFSPNDYKK